MSKGFLPTIREVLINDGPPSSQEALESSLKLFCDELVTKTSSSLNHRHWLTTVTKHIFSSLNGIHSMMKYSASLNGIHSVTNLFHHWCGSVFVTRRSSVRLPTPFATVSDVDKHVVADVVCHVSDDVDCHVADDLDCHVADDMDCHVSIDWTTVSQASTATWRFVFRPRVTLYFLLIFVTEQNITSSHKNI